MHVPASRCLATDHGVGSSLNVQMEVRVVNLATRRRTLLPRGTGVRASGDASRIPGILHLLNAAGGKPVDKDIFQTFISKHPNGPGAYWGNPKRFGEPFDSTSFFMAYSKDATAGPTAKRVLTSIVENSDAADTGWAKEGVNIAADDWRPGDQFWRDVRQCSEWV